VASKTQWFLALANQSNTSFFLLILRLSRTIFGTKIAH